jgi:hypothetical protein
MSFKTLLCGSVLAFATAGAGAADWGCQVVLCLANPAGPTAAAACVPPITRLWRDLARGRGFPSCSMNTAGSSGNSARHQYASGQNCPPAYRYYGGRDGDELMCSMSGVVSVRINNRLHTRTWWNGSETMTEYLGDGAPLPQGGNVPQAGAGVAP